MAFAGRTERVMVIGLVVAVAIAGLVAYSLRSKGYTARHVDLSDGGVWVASDKDGMFGRANLPAGSLDAVIPPPSTVSTNFQLSVAQDASAVVARDATSGKLYPVDPSAGTVLADSGVDLSSTAQVALGGGTIAILDPDDGSVRALHYDPAVGLSNLTTLGGRSRPVAKLGAGAGANRQTALAVGQDGTIWALSAGKGADRLVRIDPVGTRFSSPRTRTLNADLPAPQVTAVGSSAVVFDASQGQVILSNGKTASIPDRNQSARLQQAGPSATQVLVATPSGLYGVDLSTGNRRPLSSAGTGAAPTAPVVEGHCYYAAWSGTPGVAVRGCGTAAASVIDLQDQRILQSPTLQANRDSIVLNDLVSGGTWNLSTGRRIDNWTQARPQMTKPKPNDKNTGRTVTDAQSKPKAVADTLGARPGRTTILHVLDNDSDPAGRILTISTVTPPDNAAAHLDISPDGQTVQIQMPATGSAVHFTYTVNDNVGLQASAQVTVEPHPMSQNAPPNLRTMAARTFTVASGGQLSLPVIGDWRDADGDVPVLESATATAGRVSTTPDGRLDYIAPVAAGSQRIRYQITDNLSSSTGIVSIEVLKTNATSTVPPVAEPDVARGQVNKPIIIHPLDNDLPGADPASPDAQLRIAARIPNPDGVVIATDLQSGTVSVLASQQKDFVFSYTVAYGGAAFARGSVRVNIDGPSTKAPIAVLDSVSLHGQRPVTADVLSNDFDPNGGLLVVQHAEPANEDPRNPDLQVAIIQGRYLRINALKATLSSNPEIVNYSVTNGSGNPVTGQVVVSQLPNPANDVPVPQDDYATVRAGDATSVPVLDNDTSPSGDALTLVTDVDGAPGPGRLDATDTTGAVQGQIGRAYVTANVVRYVAPATSRLQRNVTVSYVVTNNSGDRATGHLYLTVEPPPSAGRPDQLPTPPEIDVRVVAGDTVTIPIRTTNTDPDGDSVSLVGIGQGPALGRVLGTTASSMRYQAYPNASNSGTDTFAYSVVDRYGLIGRSVVRVAVVQPGDPQPPVAADLTVTAAPGKVVSVDALAAAFRSPDDNVTLLPLSRTNAKIPGDARIGTAGVGPILVTAPTGPAPLQLRYSISNGLSEPSSATITVRSHGGTDLPPVAVDDFAAISAANTIVTVDPLSKAYDPDSPDTSDVRLSQVFSPTAKIVAGKVAIEVSARPQIIAYEIVDAGGAVAVASIFVPAAGAGAPYTKPGQQIAIAMDSTKPVTATDYAVDPAGGTLRLTTANAVSASPVNGLRVSLTSANTLVLTSIDHYSGPAAVTFQVTDGQSASDPNGVTGIITVPVQVGPETPVLRCTTSPLATVQGGRTLDIDVSSLCHVWVADPRTLDDIQYQPNWVVGKRPADLELSGSGSKTLHVFAKGTASPGQTGQITIGVAGSPAVIPGKLNLSVVAAPRPVAQPINLAGVKAGTSVTVDVRDYVTSPLVDANIIIVRRTPLSPGASVSAVGPTLTFSASKDAKGTISYDVLVTDTGTDRLNPQRQATARLTVRVLGHPDRPTDVTPDRSLLSKQANLSWTPPASNGVSIDRYVVAWDGGQQNCPASPCTIRNLTNGQYYRFTVRAVNAIGSSLPSAASAPVQPNAAPFAPTGLTVTNPQDHALTVSWNASKVDGTPVTYYRVGYAGQVKNTMATSLVVMGLNNAAPTSFTVTAFNKAGPSAATAPVANQSSGIPQYPAPPAAAQPLPMPKLTPTPFTDHQVVVLTWPATDPNGPGPVKYVVTRKNQGTTTVLKCENPRMTTCRDPSVVNDGTETTYTYTASNGTGNTSQPSIPAAITATGTPGGIKSVSLEPTGTDEILSMTFETYPVYDKSMVVFCKTTDGVDCGHWPFANATSNQRATESINVHKDGPVTIVLTQCGDPDNKNMKCSDPGDPNAAASSAAYGMLDPPTVSSATVSGPLLNFTVMYNTHGSPINVRVLVETSSRALGADPSWKTASDTTYALMDQDHAPHPLIFTDDGSPDTNGGAANVNAPLSIGSDNAARITVTLSEPPGGKPADKRGTGGTVVVQDSQRTPLRSGHVTAAMSFGSKDGCDTKDTFCAHPYLSLTGFQEGGNVTCTFTASAGTAPAMYIAKTNRDGTFNGDLPEKFTTSGANLTATCESVTSDSYRWPG